MYIQRWSCLSHTDFTRLWETWYKLFCFVLVLFFFFCYDTRAVSVSSVTRINRSNLNQGTHSKCAKHSGKLHSSTSWFGEVLVDQRGAHMLKYLNEMYEIKRQQRGRGRTELLDWVPQNEMRTISELSFITHTEMLVAIWEAVEHLTRFIWAFPEGQKSCIASFRPLEISQTL